MVNSDAIRRGVHESLLSTGKVDLEFYHASNIRQSIYMCSYNMTLGVSGSLIIVERNISGDILHSCTVVILEDEYSVLNSDSFGLNSFSTPTLSGIAWLDEEAARSFESVITLIKAHFDDVSI